MRSTDIYVHAEIQGASSVVVRNPKGGDVPPKTLLEAGTMAISYSVAWDAKVVTNAYWVRSDQVSKTAPSGEYLGTGSFMIRGKKNFLPSCHLIMGLSLLFKLEDSFIEKHRGERKVRSLEECQENVLENEMKSLALENDTLHDIIENEIELDDENDDNDDNNDLIEFPDIQLKVEHDTGRITVNNESSNANNLLEQTVNEGQVETTMKSEDVEESTIIAAAPSRKKQQQNSKKRKEGKDRKTQQNQKEELPNFNKDVTQVVKRGQKGKLKKIKAKYRDQDEEERRLRMEILNSAGKNNQISLEKKVDQDGFCGKNKETKNEIQRKHIQVGEMEDDVLADDILTGADVEMIDSLTGQPFEEDELLFVIPVVAPYNALQNYKYVKEIFFLIKLLYIIRYPFRYKVKLTPGTGKRGRAAKTALNIFSKDKACTSRERDLMKSIREEVFARNIPGKVKLSAPQLLKFKK